MSNIEKYEAAVDEAIALCNGDLRGALAALLAANEYLEGLLAQAGVQPASGAARVN